MSKIPSYSPEKRPTRTRLHHASAIAALAGGIAITGLFALVSPGQAQAQAKQPNVVMLMMDDVGWSDFGVYPGGGKALGHPTPNIDRVAKEGVTFTSWYGQSSCTAGRSSFITGRIPIANKKKSRHGVVGASPE